MTRRLIPRRLVRRLAPRRPGGGDRPEPGGPAARRPVGGILRTERSRLTALYGSLLLLAGGGLVALVYVLVGQGLYASVSGAVRTVSPAYVLPSPGASPGATPGARPSASPGERADVGRTWEPARRRPPGEAPTPEELKGYAFTQNLSDAVTDATRHRLLMYSLLALAVFAVLSIWLAWWMAGRVLRPVGVITETARRLSGENLDERIALDAPPGELKQLADTFDAMLGRMEHLVSAQRRFAANAAHELRTPLAVQRAAAEIGLAGTRRRRRSPGSAPSSSASPTPAST
ncbi:HAMP domain-containing protein [Streptomyces sp. MS1.HAVA.3]|uniref:histidine kinase n=1 Tax=Streptomyces caledonius TaxID=3134107 RepID=A0ABU8U7N8_9ACTN